MSIYFKKTGNVALNYRNDVRTRKIKSLNDQQRRHNPTFQRDTFSCDLWMAADFSPRFACTQYRPIR